jgi:hypothetical protein
LLFPVEDLRARRDEAHTALLETIALGDPAAVHTASYAWMRAWEAVHDDRPHLGDIERWSGEEAEQVVANLQAAFVAGPETTAIVVQCINVMGQPEPAALTRPLTLAQLVSAAWTRAVQVSSDSGARWGSTEHGRAAAAALAERCCTTGRYDDVEVGGALSVTPTGGGWVSWDEALSGTDVTLPVSSDTDGEELVLSFVLRAGDHAPGVTWWPGPQEHVRGWPHPLPEVPQAVTAALRVAAVDVYEREDFIPAPLLPIGHGPRRLPDLEAIEALAHGHGAEVAFALGTLSRSGVQLVVRTTGPLAVFEEQPGFVNLTGPRGD